MTRPTYKGPLGKEFLGRNEEAIAWAVSVKPGDLFNGCDGYNHVIKKIEYFYVLPVMETDDETGETYGPCHGGHLAESELENHENWTLHEVVFTAQDNDHLFYCPGGGCAVPAWTSERIKEEFQVECDDRGLKKVL